MTNLIKMKLEITFDPTKTDSLWLTRNIRVMTGVKKVEEV